MLGILIGVALPVVLLTTIVLGPRRSRPRRRCSSRTRRTPAGAPATFLARQHDRLDRRQLRRPVPADPAARLTAGGGAAGAGQRGDRCGDRPDLVDAPPWSRRLTTALARSWSRSRSSAPGSRPDTLDLPERGPTARGAARPSSPSAEDEIATVEAGQKSLHAGAVGRRHLDDPADGRRQDDADPAAHRPAGVHGRARRGVRDGLVVPLGADRRPADRCRRAGAVRAEDVRLLLPGRGRRSWPTPTGA